MLVCLLYFGNDHENIFVHLSAPAKEGLTVLFSNTTVFKAPNIFVLELHQIRPTDNFNFHSGLIDINNTIFIFRKKETHT